jgi:hypothetical protein
MSKLFDAQQPLTGPEIRIAILGNPVRNIPWTDENVQRLKDIGFNQLQLNIAWGPRPFDEPLNLIDVVTVPGEDPLPATKERGIELKRRAALTKKHGLRTMFHFGSPFMARNPYTGHVTHLLQDVDGITTDSWYDILNPKVRDHEIALLSAFRDQFPEIDDILIYTYDQDAWQTPEFQFNPFSYGVPLSDRLPGYLDALHRVWCDGRSGQARMWWEPWELSAGQVITMLRQLPRKDFGLMIHSNIAEAQLAMPVDVWFRNTARICRDLGIPVVAESFFASASEELEPLSIPAPRLIDEQYNAFTDVPGIVGVKEYYGVDPTVPDFNLDILQARLRAPDSSTAELMVQITQRFGDAQNDVKRCLELLSDGFQLYPWDTSWYGRQAGRGSTDHGWRGATIRGATFATPSWESTRCAKFMKTDLAQPHFWMLEDAQLRYTAAVEQFEEAQRLLIYILEVIESAADRDQFLQIEADVDSFIRIARSYALHLRQTNVAQMLRQDLAANRPMTHALVEELGRLLDADVSNQHEAGRVVELRRLFHQSPDAFVRRYLIPIDGSTEVGCDFSRDLPPLNASPEKGVFTLTTR